VNAVLIVFVHDCVGFLCEFGSIFETGTCLIQG